MGPNSLVGFRLPWTGRRPVATRNALFLSTTYPVKCPKSPLNPDFHPFIAFYVDKSQRFNSITLTHSTHRNFQVSSWKALFERVPYISRFSRCGINAEGES